MTDAWTIREKLYLASAVARIGENNWAAVSKIMRNMVDSNRSTEFFSQKNCAHEYTSLVDSFAIPRRKRTDPTMTQASAMSEPSYSSAQIVEKLTQQRIEELKRIIQQEQTQFRKLTKDMEMIRSGQLDHQLPIILEQMTIGKGVTASPKIASVDQPMETATPDAGDVEIAPSASPLPAGPTVPQSPIFKIESPVPYVVECPTRSETAAGNVTPTSSVQTEDSSKLKSPSTPSPASFCLPAEFVSPSKPPSLTVVKPSSPLVSPSMSPSGQTSAIQGHLLSPAKSVSHSPPRPVENQALKEMLQQLQPAVDSASENTLEIIAQVTDVAPVVEVEKLDLHLEGAAAEGSDSEEEKKPLAQLKMPDKGAEAANSEEIKEEVVAEEAMEQQREKEPPKRVLPARGRVSASAAGHRRKQNSGGSTTSSEASSTVRSTMAGPTTSKSPLPVPAPFPDYETYKQWKKMILNVWNMAAGHRHASLFLQPVRDSIAPGYSKIVKRPVDLSAIKRNIENGTLTSTEEVRRELLMMFVNAVMYNASNTEINQMARDMATDVMKHLDDLLVPINAMFSGGGVEATKSLRSNRQRHPPAERR